MRRGFPARQSAVAIMAAAVVLLAGLSAPSRAAAPPTPWDGSNPFNCTVQDAGFGPTGPDPGADPYCVRFDKTHQNVTQLGIVDFLLKEPARTAAAVPKCFYFQEDHWRATVAQSDGTAIYEWVGHYFFNKATGDGGVWVTDFTLDGHTLNPAAIPGFPPSYGPDFGPGTGGIITHNDVPADPNCAQQAAHAPSSVYASPVRPRCAPASGIVRPNRVGPLALGMRENAVRATLGPPAQVKRGFLHYCVAGGGALLVGQPGDRSGTFGSGGRAPTVMLLTTARGFPLRGRGGHLVRVGMRVQALRRAFPHTPLVARVRGMRVLRARAGILVGIRSGRIHYLAVYDRALRRKARLRSFLGRST